MELADAYEEAWAAWDESDDAVAWEAAVADGLERSAVEVGNDGVNTV